MQNIKGFILMMKNIWILFQRNKEKNIKNVGKNLYKFY